MAAASVMPQKSLVEKLQIKNGQRAGFLSVPDAVRPLLVGLPPDVDSCETLDGGFDLILVFVQWRESLAREALFLKAALKPGGLLWVAYPRGKALPTDLKREPVWQAMAPAGFQPVAQIAIDSVWSALRFKHA